MRTAPTVPNLGALLLQRRFSFRKNGKARSVTFRVGQPFRDPRGDWGISFQVEGLGPGKVIHCYGVDALQALVLALDYVRRTLPVLAEEAGGSISWLSEFDTLFGESTLHSYQFVAYLRLLEGLREIMEHLERELSPRTMWKNKRSETRRLLSRVSALVETGGVVPHAVENLRGLDRARRYMPRIRRRRRTGVLQRTRTKTRAAENRR